MQSTLWFIILIDLLGVSSDILAEDQSASGPEVIKFKMGDITLPFKHWQHQKKTKSNSCLVCHPNNIDKIPEWSKTRRMLSAYPAMKL